MGNETARMILYADNSEGFPTTYYLHDGEAYFREGDVPVKKINKNPRTGSILQENVPEGSRTDIESYIAEHW